MTSKALGPRRLFSRLAPVAAVVLGFVACTDTTENLFDPDAKIRPLEPPQTVARGGSSGLSLTDPPPLAAGGSSNTMQEPAPANGGSAGTGTVRPARPPRADAG